MCAISLVGYCQSCCLEERSGWFGGPRVGCRAGGGWLSYAFVSCVLSDEVELSECGDNDFVRVGQVIRIVFSDRQTD